MSSQVNFTPSKRRIDVTGWEMGCPVYVPAAPTSPIIWTSHSWSGRAGSGTVESWIGSVSESTKIKKKKRINTHFHCVFRNWNGTGPNQNQFEFVLFHNDAIVEEVLRLAWTCLISRLFKNKTQADVDIRELNTIRTT